MRTRFYVLALASAALVLTIAGSAVLGASGAGSGQNYVVLYKASSVPTNAGKAIQQAGGTLVHSYDELGVAIASSSDQSFRSNLLAADKSVENAAATSVFATRLEDSAAGGPPAGGLTNAPATDGDTLSPLQWDMRQIHTPQAHAITGGSPSVLVGDIDTGIDFTHPDLAPNIESETA